MAVSSPSADLRHRGALPRETVIAEYRAIARAAGFDEHARELLGALPPYLCHLLLSPDPRPRAFASFEEAATGRRRAGERRADGILLDPVGPADHVFAELPLRGHVPHGAPGINRWLTLALDELQEKTPERARFVAQWCSVIVWLTVDPDDPPETQLTSVALPMFPHCTFVTRKAIRHIPPGVILPVVGLYGLQENLFHEALHQELSATLVFDDLVAEAASEIPSVEIPWRSTAWPIDRVLHAAWVYSGLVEFRAEELERGTEGGPIASAALRSALEDAEAARDYLVNALLAHEHVFAPRGRALLETLTSRAT